MNTLRLKQLIFGCLCFLMLAIFALSLGAQTQPTDEDQLIHLPIIQSEPETSGTIPTRTPAP